MWRVSYEIYSWTHTIHLENIQCQMCSFKKMPLKLFFLLNENRCRWIWISLKQTLVNRRQTFIWINDNAVHWCIEESPGINALICKGSRDANQITIHGMGLFYCLYCNLICLQQRDMVIIDRGYIVGLRGVFSSVVYSPDGISGRGKPAKYIGG